MPDAFEPYGGELSQGYSPYPLDNFNFANSVLQMTPEEQDLYRRHLENLYGTGGVDNPDGSRSSLLNVTGQVGDRFYNIPSIYEGKALTPEEAGQKAREHGFEKFPSYASQQEAEDRYAKMHQFMERDTQAYKEGQKPSTIGQIYDSIMGALQATKGHLSSDEVAPLFEKHLVGPPGLTPDSGKSGQRIGEGFIEGVKHQGQLFKETLKLLEDGAHPSHPEVVRRVFQMALNMLPGSLATRLERYAGKAPAMTAEEAAGQGGGLGEAPRPEPSVPSVGKADVDRQLSEVAQQHADGLITKQEMQNKVELITGKPLASADQFFEHQQKLNIDAKAHMINKDLQDFITKNPEFQQQYLDQLSGMPIAHKNADGDWVVTGKFANGPGNSAHGTNNFGKDAGSQVAAEMWAAEMKNEFNQAFINWGKNFQSGALAPLPPNSAEVNAALLANHNNKPTMIYSANGQWQVHTKGIEQDIGSPNIINFGSSKNAQDAAFKYQQELEKLWADKIKKNVEAEAAGDTKFYAYDKDIKALKETPFNDMINKNADFREAYIEDAAKNAPQLVKDEYGNYIVKGDSIKHTYPEGEKKFIGSPAYGLQEHGKNQALLFHKLAIVDYQQQFQKKWIADNYVSMGTGVPQAPQYAPYTPQSSPAPKTQPKSMLQSQPPPSKYGYHPNEFNDPGVAGKQIEITSTGGFGYPTPYQNSLKNVYQGKLQNQPELAEKVLEGHRAGVDKMVFMDKKGDAHIINYKPMSMKDAPPTRLEQAHPDATRTDLIGPQDPHPGPVIAWHGTTPRFKPEQGPKGPDMIFKGKESSRDIGWHFGTSDQATYMAINKGNGEGRVIPAYLNIKKPYEMQDHGNWSGPSMSGEILDKAKTTGDAALIADAQKLHDDVKGIATSSKGGWRQDQMNLIRDYLDRHGYDSIRYQNRAEGQGWSYIVWRRNLVRSATTPDHTLYSVQGWPGYDPREPDKQDGR